MHIVHLLTRLLRAGSEENTLETCRWQIAQGHRVSLIYGAAPYPFWEDHLPRGLTRFSCLKWCIRSIRCRICAR